MNYVIHTMNHLVGDEYLGICEDGDGVNHVLKYIAFEDDPYFVGCAEDYIKKLGFKEGEELNLDEEWEKFFDEFFNPTDMGNEDKTFYKVVNEWNDLSREFNSEEMEWLKTRLNDYWILLNDEPYPFSESDEEKFWNSIAYVWIISRSSYSNNIKDFICGKIEDKFDEWQKEKTPGIKHRLTCEICYENKQIETYTACCNDKKFCKGCYKKIKGKPCPFCRGEMNHKILDQLCYSEQEFQEWFSKMLRAVIKIIRNKATNNIEPNYDVNEIQNID